VDQTLHSPPRHDVWSPLSPRHLQAAACYSEIGDLVRCAPPNIPADSDVIARMASFLNRMVDDNTPARLHEFVLNSCNADALLNSLVEVPLHDPRVCCYANVTSQCRPLKVFAYDTAAFHSCFTVPDHRQTRSNAPHLRIGDVIWIDLDDCGSSRLHSTGQCTCNCHLRGCMCHG